MEKKVSALVMDVDGTLTDGGIYVSSGGECFKSFHVKDGYGIYNILPRYGIVPIIITGRISKIVSYRAEELEIKELHQGIADKVACLQNISSTLHIPLTQIACIGDDVNDLPMMKLCSVNGCPADAVSEVQAFCGYICKVPGGRGAVREFIEWLVQPDRE